MMANWVNQVLSLEKQVKVGERYREQRNRSTPLVSSTIYNGGTCATDESCDYMSVYRFRAERENGSETVPRVCR